jgi:hypothetical protein
MRSPIHIVGDHQPVGRDRILMHILQSIFQDPEYLALSDYEQLAVLEVIYSFLETTYNQRISQSKYQGKNPFFD